MRIAYILVWHYKDNTSRIIGCYTNPELRARVRAANVLEEDEALEDVDIEMEGV